MDITTELESEVHGKQNPEVGESSFSDLTPGNGGRRIRTLLVDDRPAFLDLAARFLSAYPQIEVIGRATTGREALAQVLLLNPDLVLMDVAMPGMNGLEATSRIKSLAHPPRIIILTLHDLPAYQTIVKEIGADGFLNKTEFGHPLLQLIRELFRERTGKQGLPGTG